MTADRKLAIILALLTLWAAGDLLATTLYPTDTTTTVELHVQP
jgi:hypothetical protein